MNDLQLAIAVLVDGGSSQEEAKQTVLARPEITAELAPQIAAKRAEFDGYAEQARQEVHAASPAGRAEAARAAATAVQEREQLVADAKVLLGSEGRFGPDELAGMTPDEVLHAARIEVKPALMNQDERDAAALQLAHSGEWSRMNDLEKGQTARDLGGGDVLGFVNSMDDYVADLNGGEEGGEGDAA